MKARFRVLLLVLVTSSLTLVAPAPARIAARRLGHLDQLATRQLGDAYGCTVNPDAPEDWGRAILNVTDRDELASAWTLVVRTRLTRRVSLAVVAPRYGRARLDEIAQGFRPPRGPSRVSYWIATNTQHCYIAIRLLPSASESQRTWAARQRERYGADRVVISVPRGPFVTH